MLAILCELCGTRIAERGYHIQITEGKIVLAGEHRERTMFSQRGTILYLDVCSHCGETFVNILRNYQDNNPVSHSLKVPPSS